MNAEKKRERKKTHNIKGTTTEKEKEKKVQTFIIFTPNSTITKSKKKCVELFEPHKHIEMCCISFNVTELITNHLQQQQQRKKTDLW